MKLSSFGDKFSGPSGIVTLMEDLGSALLQNPDMIMMGGGTPARIEPVLALFQHHLQIMAQDNDSLFQLLGRYQGPMGDIPVRTLLADALRTEYGWAVTAEHIAITNGGQSAFGILANMLTGENRHGHVQRLLFPLAPEYLGYADEALHKDAFTAVRPLIDLLPEHQFKYQVNFADLHLSDDIAALCVSRPTNPSGNIISNADMQKLDALALDRGIPFIVDAAYGAPFPGIIFDDSEAYWSENVILMQSLSKVGLPGTRCGFLIASPERVLAFSRANTIFNLASGNLGPALAESLLKAGDLMPLCREVILPWYRQRMQFALQCITAEFGALNYRIHRPEGAFFLWLWLPDLPVATAVLYEKLKLAGVLIIPGEAAFFGLEEPWEHSQQCLRISIAIPEVQLAQGIALIARTLRSL